MRPQNQKSGLFTICKLTKDACILNQKKGPHILWTKFDQIGHCDFVRVVRLQEMDSQSYRKAAALSIMCYSVL